MRTRIILFIFLFSFPFVSIRAQVTFTEHIAPIIYNKCSPCHHKGGIGPISLANYTDAKYSADMIRFATEVKFMPPWMPNKSYSHFLDERTLTDSEIKLIQDWIKNGMPEGEKAAEPELPAFAESSDLGKPDLVLSMKEAYLHKGDNKDEYRIFVLPTHLQEAHQIKAIEIVPGNPKIAHHIILGLDTTSYANKLDAKDPKYGYEQYGGFGFYPTYDNWSGWIPGNKTRFFPADIGNYILPNSSVLLQMHYGPTPIDTKDSTTINIYFAKEPVERFIKTYLISPINITDGPFYIPANTTKTFHAKYKVVENVSLISITPHAHWIGSKWEIFSVNPKGDTTKLIKIDDWDFNWQNFFSFNRFVNIEKGATIYCNATYDNTTENKANPNNPPKNTTWGESAFDEMFLCYIAYVPYKQGDETIEIAGANNSLSVEISNNKINIRFSLINNSFVDLKLYDTKGNLVNQLIKKQPFTYGKHLKELAISELKAGTYYCKITTPSYTDSKRIVVN